MEQGEGRGKRESDSHQSPLVMKQNISRNSVYKWATQAEQGEISLNKHAALPP